MLAVVFVRDEAPGGLFGERMAREAAHENLVGVAVVAVPAARVEVLEGSVVLGGPALLLAQVRQPAGALGVEARALPVVGVDVLDVGLGGLGQGHQQRRRGGVRLEARLAGLARKGLDRRVVLLGLEGGLRLGDRLACRWLGGERRQRGRGDQADDPELDEQPHAASHGYITA
ncbi:hypothetical protein D3C86_1583860 [compost metagenome]